MNVQDFTYLLQHPDKVVSPVQTRQLEDILEEYPYFQAARALHLKGLKNLNSFKYNNALKLTAAYTTDRDVLFDFITSKDFLQHSTTDKVSDSTSFSASGEITAKEVQRNTEKPAILIEESEDKPLPRTVKDAKQILDPKLFKSKYPKADNSNDGPEKETKAELGPGQPLPFTRNEKHSFAEWLQLASLKPIARKPEDTIEKVTSSVVEKDSPLEEENLKKKKFQRIDKFIANNPKIVPQQNPLPKMDSKAFVKFDKNELMTETLAKVYLEQKKYKKAIQAYRILSLKYPEKSGFFADRITRVEKIQQENT